MMNFAFRIPTVILLFRYGATGTDRELVVRADQRALFSVGLDAGAILGLGLRFCATGAGRRVPQH